MRIVGLVGGALVVWSGALVIVWLANGAGTAQGTEDFAVTRCLVGFAFLLAGVATLAFAFRKHGITVLLGYAVSLVGAVASIVSFFSDGTSRALAAVVSTLRDTQLHPDRLAPALGLSLVACGVALAALGAGNTAGGRVRTVLIAVALALPMSAMAVTGYFMGPTGTAGWDAFVGADLQPAGLLVLLNIALLVATCEHAPASAHYRAHWLPVRVGICVATAMLAAWHALRAEQHGQMVLIAQATADDFRTRFEGITFSQLRTMERMVRRWEYSNGTARGEWEDDATAYVATVVGLESVAWVDAAEVVRWIAPVGGTANAQGADLSREPRMRAVLKAAREGRRLTVSRPMELARDGKGVLVICPLFPRGRWDGYIIGTFRLEKRFDALLTEMRAASYSVSVFDGVERIYGPPTDTLPRDGLMVEASLAIPGNTWRAVLAPTPEFRARHASNLPHVVLFLGMGLAAALMVAVNAAQRARAKSVALDVTNRELGHEISQRTQTGLLLRESEERFRQAFEFAGIGIALVGLDGRWLRMNRSLCDLVGYTESQLSKKTFQDITHPDDLDADLAHVRQLIAGEAQHYQMEKRYFHREGRIVWIRLTGSIVRRSSGEPLHFIAQIEDITARKHAEEALRESEEEFRQLAASSPIGIFRTDTEGRYTYTNSRWQAIAGLGPAAVLGDGWALAIHPDDRTAIFAAWSQVVQKSEEFARAFRFRRHDGETRWVSVRAAAVRKDRGRALGYVGSCADITESRLVESALRESEERTRMFAEHAPAAVAMFDREMRYLVVSARWLTDYGLDGQNVIGRSHYEVFPDIPDRWKEIHQRCLAGKVESCAADPFDRANGRRIWLRWEVRPWFRGDGSVAGIVMFTADITELKELQQQLLERNAALEVETRRAHDANRLKSEFLANMSHELRTPLNGIIGFSTFLRSEKPGPLNADQKEFLGDVLNSGRHLLQLITDLLDLAKIEAGKLELSLEPFSLRAAMAEVSGVLRPLIDEKQLTFESSIEIDTDEVTLDLRKFRQLLYNLLSNAIKFNGAGGRVIIQVRPHGVTHFALRVTDTGIGIKSEDLGRLFVEFQQLETGASRRFQGTGLGLALTKKIVTLHGGTIHVDSEYGLGSTFTVVFPLTMSSPPA